jgi:hypothetical protein
VPRMMQGLREMVVTAAPVALPHPPRDPAVHQDRIVLIRSSPYRSLGTGGGPAAGPFSCRPRRAKDASGAASDVGDARRLWPPPPLRRRTILELPPSVLSFFLSWTGRPNRF